MDRKSLSKHNLAVNKHKVYGVFRAALPVFPQLFATTHHSFVTSTRLLKKNFFFTSNYTAVAWLQTPQLLIVWLLCYKELVWPDEFKLTVTDQQFEFDKSNFFFVAILLPQLNRLGRLLLHMQWLRAVLLHSSNGTVSLSTLQENLDQRWIGRSKVGAGLCL